MLGKNGCSFEIMGILVGILVAVGAVALFATAGCGGDNGVVDYEVPGDKDGSGTNECEPCDDFSCDDCQCDYSAHARVIAELRDSVRQLEDQLALCSGELDSTGDALSECDGDLVACEDNLGAAIVELEECDVELQDCVCNFTKPGDRCGWWKALNCER